MIKASQKNKTKFEESIEIIFFQLETKFHKLLIIRYIKFYKKRRYIQNDNLFFCQKTQKFE